MAQNGCEMSTVQVGGLLGLSAQLAARCEAAEAGQKAAEGRAADLGRQLEEAFAEAQSLANDTWVRLQSYPAPDTRCNTPV